MIHAHSICSFSYYVSGINSTVAPPQSRERTAEERAYTVSHVSGAPAPPYCECTLAKCLKGTYTKRVFVLTFSASRRRSRCATESCRTLPLPYCVIRCSVRCALCGDLGGCAKKIENSNCVVTLSRVPKLGIVLSQPRGGADQRQFPGCITLSPALLLCFSSS